MTDIIIQSHCILDEEYIIISTGSIDTYESLYTIKYGNIVTDNLLAAADYYLESSKVILTQFSLYVYKRGRKKLLHSFRLVSCDTMGAVVSQTATSGKGKTFTLTTAVAEPVNPFVPKRDYSSKQKNIFIPCIQCWINVEAAGPTLYK